ncbi:MBL fold metallo-hydrolase [Tessaracoccus sp. Z1128]
MTARVEHLVTAGNSDPAGPPVHENNVWIVGDASEVVLIDPAHDAAAVDRAVAGRIVTAILLTHGHWDHIRAALDVAALAGAPVHLHDADRFLWEAEHGRARFEPLRDGDTFAAGGVVLETRHTPGHTPGSTSFVAAALGCVFSGDTLFEGGPGATRWHYSSFERIIGSIETRLFTLPVETVVHTGHGPSTTIGAERPALPEWIRRGW